MLCTHPIMLFVRLIGIYFALFCGLVDFMVLAGNQP